MRYGKLCLWIGLVLSVWAGGGCGKKAGSQMDTGRFEGSVYRNDYLALTVTLPADWHVQDQQSVKDSFETGEKVMAGSNDNMRAALQAASSKTFNLVTVFKYPMGSPVAYNPQFNCVAEGVSHLPGIQTGGDYLFHVRRLLESGQMKFTFPREVYIETLSGVEFHVLTAQLALMPTKIVTNEYIATVRKGYTLLFILSYTTDEERTELRNILSTISLAPLAKQ
ncbi:MAG: hypothetical protein ACM3VT_14535 [Solirubrobacterales bacterium]